MKVRNILWAASVAATISLAGEGHAGGLTAHTSVNVNIRSGPGVRFPVAGLASGGSSMMIHGCVSRYTWCDVSMGGVRGWASAAHLQVVYENRRIYVPAYAVQAEIPIVSFHLTEYWNDYYHDREFYADRASWSSYHWEDDGLPPGWRDNWDDDDHDHEY
jgi:uncharacterized protein YraI